MELVLNVEEYTLYEKRSLETISRRFVEELVKVFNELDEASMWDIPLKCDCDENTMRINSERYLVRKCDATNHKELDEVEIDIPHFYPNSEKALYPQLQHYIKEVVEKAINNAVKRLNATVKINLIHKLKNFVDFDGSSVCDSDDDKPRLSSRTLSLKMVDARNALKERLKERLKDGGGKPNKNVLSLHSHAMRMFSWRFNINDLWCVDLTDTTIGDNLMYYYRDIEEPEEHFDKVVLWNGGTFYCDTTYSFKLPIDDEEKEHDDVVFYFIDEELSINCAILWCDEENEQGIGDKIYLLYNPANKIHTLKYEDDTASAIHTELMFIDGNGDENVVECYERADGYNASPEENVVSSFNLDKCKIELFEYMD